MSILPVLCWSAVDWRFWRPRAQFDNEGFSRGRHDSTQGCLAKKKPSFEVFLNERWESLRGSKLWLKLCRCRQRISEQNVWISTRAVSDSPANPCSCIFWEVCNLDREPLRQQWTKLFLRKSLDLVWRHEIRHLFKSKDKFPDKFIFFPPYNVARHPLYFMYRQEPGTQSLFILVIALYQVLIIAFASSILFPWQMEILKISLIIKNTIADVLHWRNKLVRC